jgi:hypothetical protein
VTIKPALIAFAAGACLAGAATGAFAAKSCDELKSEIAAKLDAKKVPGYTLEIVDADKAGGGDDKKTGRVVGSCEGGAKKIVYTKK